MAVKSFYSLIEIATQLIRMSKGDETERKQWPEYEHSSRGTEMMSPKLIM